MVDTIQATRRFRLKILACLLMPHWMRRFGPIIKPEYFDREDENVVCEAFLNFYEAYKRPPSDIHDILDMIDNDDVTDALSTVFIGRDEWDLEYAADRAVQFAQQQAAKMAVLESLPDISNGELGSVLERMQEAMKVGQDLADVGIDLHDDVDAWLTASVLDRTPTGILHLDIAMGGGLAAGELGVIAAPPNYGKSMALVNVGFGAMGPLSRCNVAHFTLEMSKNVVAKRYAARTIFRFPTQGMDLPQYKDDFLRRANVMLPGKVRIFDLRGTVDDLRRQMDVLIDTGYEPDLIVVDYGDEMQPKRRRNDDRYTELGEIFGDLRLVGFDYDCPVWTGTQTGRHSLNKETITMGDLAESFKKAHKADAIVALCQTVEEERTNQCRLFLAKLRDGKSRAMIRCKYYKEQQSIVSTGFATYNASPGGEE